MIKTMLGAVSLHTPELMCTLRFLASEFCCSSVHVDTVRFTVT